MKGDIARFVGQCDISSELRQSTRNLVDYFSHYPYLNGNGRR
jgi:hypothetical protein